STTGSVSSTDAATGGGKSGLGRSTYLIRPPTMMPILLRDEGGGMRDEPEGLLLFSRRFAFGASSSCGARAASGRMIGLASSQCVPGVMGKTRRSSRIAPPRVWYGYQYG